MMEIWLMNILNIQEKRLYNYKVFFYDIINMRVEDLYE